jgi:diguanylate cyclase (GGDEF)-like protein
MLKIVMGETLSGQRLKQKILLALVFGFLIPLLVLAYVWHAHILPLLPSMVGDSVLSVFLPLIFFTALLMTAGGYVIWEVISAVIRLVDLVTSNEKSGMLEERSDEIGTLMTSFSRMLATIEKQAAEINATAAGLDAAHRELELTNARLRELSLKDEVTGLYNRRFFRMRLEEEILRSRRYNHPVAVVLLDIDNFKEINDALGHGAGDETLRALSQCAILNSRGVSIIARYGGDEFAVLLPQTSQADALVYAERLRATLAEASLGPARSVTASFGVASLSEDGLTSGEELIRDADEALYAAKRRGKNTVVGYEAELVEAAAERCRV